MPVLAQGTVHDAVPVVSAGTGDVPATLTLGELPVDELQPVVPVASTGNGSRWRVERFGPKAPDGKGRYWQFRRGSGKQREASYGGKIENESADYWHNRNASTNGHTGHHDSESG